MTCRPNPDRWQRVYSDSIAAGRTDQEAADAADADRCNRFRVATKRWTEPELPIGPTDLALVAEPMLATLDGWRGRPSPAEVDAETLFAARFSPEAKSL